MIISRFKRFPALALASAAVFLAPFVAVAETAISLGGNAYTTVDPSGAQIRDSGITRWRDPNSVISAYFSIQKPQENVKVSIRVRGEATIKVTIAGTEKEISYKNDEFKSVEIGTFSFPVAGYQRVDFTGVSKAGSTYGDISDILLDGVEGGMNYVDNGAITNYWGRRGPSVHMGYELPKDKDVEYFYNEVHVPTGEDVLHSYFMACGFGQGYFGIQVNSPHERRILFSVWSPFDTQDPKKIPEDQRIKMLRRGKDVHIGEFGNEGSGGQSYLRYPWVAGTTYKFLMKIRPTGNGSTDYTAYFFPPEEGQWRLIASFQRPKTDTWVKGTHSFLENFSPQMGWRERHVEFGNQWARDKDGNWYEMTKGRFTCDATGGAKVRMDYTGGVTENKKRFFLKNCGFFNENTPSRTPFTRESSGQPHPEIDLDALEKL
ncbi:MAG: DUF3472 domain-containing protein [Puniceicoccales bacterium]|jgi:hypothetical protein|nr:DUF3472 domain-containing protein [Puniceicoccales bacterium]